LRYVDAVLVRSRSFAMGMARLGVAGFGIASKAW